MYATTAPQNSRFGPATAHATPSTPNGPTSASVSARFSPASASASRANSRSRPSPYSTRDAADCATPADSVAASTATAGKLPATNSGPTHRARNGLPKNHSPRFTGRTMYSTQRVALRNSRRMPAWSPRASIALTPGVSVVVTVRRSVLAYSTSRAAVAKNVTCPAGRNSPTTIAPVCTVTRPASIARKASTLKPRTCRSVARSTSRRENRSPGRNRKHSPASTACSARFAAV